MAACSQGALVKVRSLWQKNEDTLAIEWTDGLQQEYLVSSLRVLCPCAACVDEFTGKRTIKKDQIPKDIKPVEIFSVGRYALGVIFSDGHKTGIYTFDYLRSAAFQQPFIQKDSCHDHYSYNR